jgi:hypothetical protein
MDPCKGSFELLASRPIVCRVEYVRMKFVSKPCIPYENGGPVALYVNKVVIATIDEIRPLLEVEAVKTIVVQTCEGELGGETPPIVAVVQGV